MLKKMQLNPGWSNHEFALFCGFYRK